MVINIGCIFADTKKNCKLRETGNEMFSKFLNVIVLKTDECIATMIPFSILLYNPSSPFYWNLIQKKIMFVSEIPTELIIGQDFKPYKPGSASLLFKFKGNLPDF